MAPRARFATQPRVVLAGSEKAPFTADSPVVKALQATAPRPAAGPVSVSVMLKPKEAVDRKALARPGTPHLTRAGFGKRHGADTTSAKLVSAFATEYGLATEQASPGMLRLTGTAAAMQKAFGVTLRSADADGRTYRVREGAITLPEELDGHVLAVLGLDNRPQAVPHFRVRPQAAAANTSFTPVQIAQLYGFPQGASADGQTIALIELGGGYRQADLAAYFKSLGMAAPAVVAVSVDKGKNAPSNAQGADGEVMLDIEVAAAVAPGAKIAVYFAPNTDQGFVDAISAAVHDKVNKPSLISISWGSAEPNWTGQAVAAMDAACAAAASVGVTITVACGDNGSTDGVTDGANHVDFPASSPHVLACGGTRLAGSGAAIASETVWNELAANEGATGGGVSTLFPLPAWQKNAGVPASTVAGGGRGVPDVAGDADPATGYTIRVDGQTMVIGGTSAVAPLWAGLIALANAQNKASAGFVNPTLYAASAKKAFRDITQGTNGGFQAGPGWDACTGLGSPVGTALIAALGKSAASRKTAKA